MEGARHPDRDAQFRYLNEQARTHLAAGQPVVSVDTKKKEVLVGRFAVGANRGWVGVGTDHDTAAFAVQTLRRWWQQVGRVAYPEATRLLVCADVGGSNGYRVRAWKTELARLAAETGL